MAPEFEKLAAEALPQNNEFVQAVAQNITPDIPAISSDISEIVIRHLAAELPANRQFVEAVAESVDVDDMARCFSDHVDMSDIVRAIDLSALAYEIDTDKIEERMAERIDVTDVANELDTDEIAEQLDYRKLALALISAIQEKPVCTD